MCDSLLFVHVQKFVCLIYCKKNFPCESISFSTCIPKFLFSISFFSTPCKSELVDYTTSPVCFFTQGLEIGEKKHVWKYVRKTWNVVKSTRACKSDICSMYTILGTLFFLCRFLLPMSIYSENTVSVDQSVRLCSKYVNDI